METSRIDEKGIHDYELTTILNARLRGLLRDDEDSSSLAMSEHDDKKKLALCNDQKLFDIAIRFLDDFQYQPSYYDSS